ncbi:MAG: stalk domain-containing protein, partial [Paenibacillaceae bacterium]
MKKLKSIFISSIAVVTLFSVTTAFSAERVPLITGSNGNVLLTVSTVSGNGEFGSTNGATADALYRAPQGIALATDGSIFVADTQSHLIRQVKEDQVTTFAGLTLDLDELGLPEGGISDGKKEQSVFQDPKGMVVDARGNLFIADNSNNAIRKIDSAGNVTTIAGNPEGLQGFADGKGQLALFNQPSDVVVASNGTLYVTDTLNHAIRSITAQGVVATLNAESIRSVEIFDGVVELAGDFKDGKLSEALFNEPTGLALDAKGNLYVSDTGNQLIRYIDLAAGTVSTVAGGTEAVLTETSLYAEADFINGVAAEAKFNFPKGLALSSEGGLYIADSQNNAIRYLFNNRVITVAGDGLGTFGDQNGTERRSMLNNPTDVAVNSTGDLFIADSYNNKIKKVSLYQLPASLNNNGSIHVVNGTKEVTFDAKPQNVNGRVMVPIRAITEALGYNIHPKGSTEVILTKGTTTIDLTIGSVDVKKTVDGVVES